MKSKMTGKEYFGKMKEYIIIPQEISENWIKMLPNVGSDLLMVDLKKKEQVTYDKLVKNYILENN